MGIIYKARPGGSPAAGGGVPVAASSLKKARMVPVMSGNAVRESYG